MKRIHFIQHVPFEELGYIHTWLSEGKYQLTSTKVWEDSHFPDMATFDGLIVMGGPMGAYEEDLYPWLKDEKAFIANAIQGGKKVMGICLGAQLIAAVLGATVFVHQPKEIGWFPVTLQSSFAEWLGKEIPSSITVFHWHGDSFTIPEGCESCFF
jgi:GMP synthase-like glutamine amidotransferase